MYAQSKKSNSTAMIMLAMQIKTALELANQQAEQDAQIIKQSERYAEEHGMTVWNKGW